MFHLNLPQDFLCLRERSWHKFCVSCHERIWAVHAYSTHKETPMEEKQLFVLNMQESKRPLVKLSSCTAASLKSSFHLTFLFAWATFKVRWLLVTDSKQVCLQSEPECVIMSELRRDPKCASITHLPAVRQTKDPMSRLRWVMHQQYISWRENFKGELEVYWETVLKAELHFCQSWNSLWWHVFERIFRKMDTISAKNVAAIPLPICLESGRIEILWRMRNKADRNEMCSLLSDWFYVSMPELLWNFCPNKLLM